jgi:hypothetical protein
MLIAICTSTSLADLLFDGTVTAHLLFGYPVDDKEDAIDVNPTQCEIKQEQQDFLHEMSVLF